MSRFLVPRANWRDEYMQALDKAAQQKPVDNGLFSACAQLSDRIAVLEAENSLLQQQRASPSSRAAAQTPTPAPDLELQRDLAEALRQKSAFETRLRAAETELETLRVQSKSDARELKTIRSEWAQFSTKTKDLEHELREKKRLLDNLQDEILTMNLQLTMAESQRDKIKAENKELVDRFLEYKSRQVDAMNKSNEPRSDRRHRDRGDASNGRSSGRP